MGSLIQMQARRPNAFARDVRRSGQLHGAERRAATLAAGGAPRVPGVSTRQPVPGIHPNEQHHSSKPVGGFAPPTTGGNVTSRPSAIQLRQDRLRTANPTRFPGGTSTPAASQPPISDPAKQIAHLESNIAKFGAKNRPNDVRRLEALRAAQTPAPVAANPSPTEGQLPDDGGAITTQPVGNPEIANTFFPSMRAFEPENYEGSPLYKFQQQKGEEAINRVLSKRGLRDSGAEIQALSDFNRELAAGEADKTRGYAQTEADRFERLTQNEANRLERRDDANFDRAYKWTNMFLNQNPMDYAVKGTDNYAKTVGDEAKTIANYLPSLYAKAVGGGGGAYPAYQSPFPSSPDFSGIDQVAAIMNGSGNNGMFSGIINSLPGFLDPKTWS